MTVLEIKSALAADLEVSVSHWTPRGTQRFSARIRGWYQTGRQIGTEHCVVQLISDKINEVHSEEVNRLA